MRRALTVVGAALLAMLILAGCAASPSPTSRPVAAVGGAATTTVETTAATTVATTTPKPKPAVAVTKESGESECLVKSFKTVDGRNYVVVDYVVMEPNPDAPDQYHATNSNPKLRTFELTGASWLGAFNLAEELYGEKVVKAWGDDLTIHSKGTKLKLSDFKRIVASGKANHWGEWHIKVRNGHIVTLVQTFQS